MIQADPFLPLSDWRAALYRGEPAQVDRFLDAIDRSLSNGWVRDLEFEQTHPRPDRIRCYLFDQPRDAAVRVWLQRVTATRVRGGAFQVIRHPTSGDVARIARLVAGFRDGSVLPSAAATSLRSTLPAFGPRSVLPFAEMSFTRFADTVDGAWPFDDQAQRVWEELVVGCLAKQVAIDRVELTRWLMDNGWNSGQATTLTDQFFADSEWFARRLAVMTP